MTPRADEIRGKLTDEVLWRSKRAYHEAADRFAGDLAKADAGNAAMRDVLVAALAGPTLTETRRNVLLQAADLIDVAAELEELSSEGGPVAFALLGTRIRNAVAALAGRPEAAPMFCNAEHAETGAVCELPIGHTQNHRGQFDNGVAQWPEPASPRPSEAGAALVDSREHGDPVNLTPYVWPTMQMMLTQEERDEWGVREDLSMQLNIVRAIAGLQAARPALPATGTVMGAPMRSVEWTAGYLSGVREAESKQAATGTGAWQRAPQLCGVYHLGHFCAREIDHAGPHVAMVIDTYPPTAHVTCIWEPEPPAPTTARG